MQTTQEARILSKTLQDESLKIVPFMAVVSIAREGFWEFEHPVRRFFQNKDTVSLFEKSPVGRCMPLNHFPHVHFIGKHLKTL